MNGAELQRDRQLAPQAFMRADLPTAEAACNRVLAALMGDLICLHLSGRIAATRGRFDEAESIYKTCLTLRPRDASIRLSYSSVFMHRGQPDRAIDMIEQIIDAHPRGHGAGELTAIDALPTRIPRTLNGDADAHAASGAAEYPECMSRVDVAMLDGFANEYLEQITACSPPGTLRTVNKSLETYKFVGLVQMLLPRARVIFCRRDPIDTCLSIYMNMFTPRRYPWKMRMEDLAFVYQCSTALIEHWKRVIDLPWMEVQYEALVANQEAKTREIIDFCGLDWDDACLAFHKTGRTVMTLSHDQVSQPIYASAVKRYERYATHLQPLIEALDAGTAGRTRA